MAPVQTAVATKPAADISEHVAPAQTLRAANALLRKIRSDETTRDAEKPSLLADADEDKESDKTPVWLILTTKKHIIDKQRLKPGKILLPHPYLDTSDPTLRICLITADPQRAYKDIVAHPSFPLDVSARIARVIGISKLKAKYNTFETKRQLLGEYDVFLADDRIGTQLPSVLGKTFYKQSSKRPVPVNLQGRSQNFDEQGNKRRKLAEGGTKVVKADVKPTDVAREVERALSCALVHLAPSTTTSVKVGLSSMEPEQLQENIETVVAQMVEKYVPQKWRNLKAVHIKGPNTAALPIFVAEELWEDENDVLEEPLPAKEKRKGKKRGFNALEDGGVALVEQVIEVPGPDGKMRRVEKSSMVKGDAPAAAGTGKKSKKAAEESLELAAAKEAEKVEKAARREALQKQKVKSKGAANGTKTVVSTDVASSPKAKKVRVTRATAADLI